MDDEKFELMYRFPGEEQHLPLPSALDYLYWELQNLKNTNQDLWDYIYEQNSKIEQLTDKLDRLSLHVDTF